MGPTGTDSLPVSGDDGGPSSVHHVAAPKTIGSSSLDALQSTDSRRVMDIVDKLRRSGLSGILQLPQLVVSGDQSSGKSSVLEAITEIPFPRKENLCTRFATEIILRRATTTSINTKIIPDKQRPSTEKKRLEQFKSTIVDFAELPNLMEEATNLMGLGDDGSGIARAFSRDVLSIEIAGPGRPHLTLVDLPGLIHSENKMQSKEDVALIQGLVDDYIREKRTIIMAVVSAKNDYANQIILKKCRDIDPKGNRTVGIITKPDFLEPGSENEASWIELAENKDIFFELGWHMLKNRSDKEASKSFTERNATEAAFFGSGRYRDLPPEMLGIESLRGRLSQMLYKHLKAELPSLQKELNEKHDEVVKELEKLGEKRATARDQRRFLTKISQDYQDVAKAATNGQYEHDFFGNLDPEASVDHESNIRRVRAVVQYLNLQFASAMRQYGHKRITNASGELSPALEDDKKAVEPALDEDYAQFSTYQVAERRADAIERVRRILVRSRGRELPGTFNPLLISQLFWEQSHHWKAIAEFHIEKVAQVCANFVAAAITCTVADDVAHRLQAFTVDPALDARLKRAKAELIRIIADNKHHPITYDPKYTAMVQDTRRKKSESKLKRIVDQAKISVYNGLSKVTEPYLKPDVLDSGKGDLLELDMDKTSAEDALDSQQAYYKEEVKYFISAVTKQVVERHLMRDLAADTISPTLIGDMTDDEIAFVAAEPEETTRLRGNLETRKAMLEKGQETFKSALGLCK
ncbi:hypothetical protein B0A54_07101 [Friedmanniomyces endolithicus]|nr:hypothetical protein LTS09_007235 [Friedmanniomyces endolithicus]KAK0288390.1 hypothetical protein LTS00_009601 [Friedmanniomyces endolithicus]KAK0831687.1 hypothetical protein LTR73_003070 [Friedmanniomyces endolithicus]KAK1000387.1 hypothetical protein LTS01_004949 [Friedmanniomyces endolithicus]KAK1017405.1 hypothetical protein LTR54_002783 [Friedmanniomyces endolithicus]